MAKKWIVYGIAASDEVLFPKRLVYIGMTGNFSQRKSMHNCVRYGEMNLNMFVIDEYDDRARALKREAKLIRTLKPRDNVVGNKKAGRTKFTEADLVEISAIWCSYSEDDYNHIVRVHAVQRRFPKFKIDDYYRNRDAILASTR